MGDQCPTIHWKKSRKLLKYATQQQSAPPVEILSRYSAGQEIYSIDESFIALTGTVASTIA